MIRFRSTTKVADLVKALADIDKKVARKALRQAVNQATAPILKDAKAKVPTDTKSLKKALGKKVKSYRSGIVIVGVVGVRKDKKGKPEKHKRKVGEKKSGEAKYRNPVHYAHLVEFGTRKHAIGKGDRLKRKDRKQKRIQTGRKHPGAKKQPFMRPALDKNRRQIPATMIRVLSAALATAKKR